MIKVVIRVGICPQSIKLFPFIDTIGKLIKNKKSKNGLIIPPTSPNFDYAKSKTR